MSNISAVLNDFKTLLASIPTELWSVITGSGLTLLGVVIANRHSAQQQKRQLSHEAGEKSKDRKAEMRKTVYLESAEELIKANAVLATLPQKELDQLNQASQLSSFFASMSKVQLVADPKTAKLANNLASSYGEVFGQAIERAMPVLNAAENVKIHSRLYDEYQIEIKRIQAEINSFNESGREDPLIRKRLNSGLQFYIDRSNAMSAARSEHAGRHLALHIESMRFTVGAVSKLTMELVPLLVELRRELDVGGDLNDFKKILEDQSARMKKMSEDIASKIQVV